MSQHEFKPGDKVRVKESALDGYVAEFQRRVKDGRVGVVTSIGEGYRLHPGRPFVVFPADGRKKEYRPGQIKPRDLELVEPASN